MYRIYTRQGWRLSLGGLGLAALLNLVAGDISSASMFPPCPPPAASEYLLLVRGETEAQRTRVQELLPSNSTVLVCNYLEDTVVRAGGFSNLESANAWAQYMTEVEGLQAFVARPATPAEQAGAVSVSPIATATANTPTNAAPAAPSNGSGSVAVGSNRTGEDGTQTVAAAASRPFSPRALGSGFAVLVDYQNRPETAVEIQRSVGQAIGLAVHRQRPYLLIAHSPDVQGAASTLAVLTSKSIPGFVVDSQGVVMLTNAIALQAQ
ncbi:hypothetical protein [Pseudanabaena sp. FACHB-2040]|uniref:hypothetical protein n=1 Tax=Pseudanabaena sp. FACHB-2040 TaxID=2692859 RepID=UPI00168550F6|nr:hypothetical protein [Pseudanabaena sp. FACHB-2040]MBD2260642.1 hypothetical protein [Pseudanabaena sp. FACHB-2040]